MTCKFFHFRWLSVFFAFRTRMPSRP